MKNLVLRLSIGLLFICLASGIVVAPVAEAATLRGTVADSKTGEGLSGANVRVSMNETGEVISTVVGATGEFEIRDLAAGGYTVTVSRAGHAEKVLSNVVLNVGNTKSIGVELSQDLIQLDPITVTPSRRPEKAREAPASVSVLDASQIEARPSLTVTGHLRSVSSVDIVSSGLTQSNVVARGFNQVFTGALMSLVDNRIARIPSLRANVYSFLPTADEDIERIEVALGPGSALYGPNSANGVMHILTKSPFGSEGTTLSIGGGERSVLTSAFRHAGSLNEKVGYKISGQYYQGEDWNYNDPKEVKLRQAKIDDGADPGQIGQRDFDVKKLSGEARLDLRPTDNLTAILSSGFTRADQIEPTGIGAGQFKNWTYSHFQGRLRYKDLFAQVFLNRSNAGDSFILRSGESIIDKSNLLVGQIQHGAELGDRQRFTYGVDLLLTRPATGGSINGRNEDADDINEIGGYVQSETELLSKLKFVAAARVDEHNHIDDLVFSPRAALVFQPHTDHNFRATYNRAFRTPTTNNLFLDLSVATIPNPFVPGANLAAIRARGVPSTGWTFNRGSDGRAQMYSQFDQVDGYADATVNNVWLSLRGILVAQTPSLDGALPTQLSETVDGIFRDLTTNNIIEDVTDVNPVKPTITNTFEVGYKGVIGGRLILGADVYRTKKEDFTSPLRVETPNVFADPATLAPVLTDDIAARLVAAGLPEDQASAQAQGIVEQIVPTIAQTPLGVVSPEQVQDDTEVILTYRNFGDVSLYGTDVNLTYYANENWNFSGNYSHISKDFFKNVDGISDIALNAPKHKFGAGVQYLHPNVGLTTQLRLRYVDGFPVNVGVYVGDIESYAVLDLNAGYNLSFSPNTRVSLTVQNLLAYSGGEFTQKHREFVGAPEIGRLTLVRLTQSF